VTTPTEAHKVVERIGLVYRSEVEIRNPVVNIHIPALLFGCLSAYPASVIVPNSNVLACLCPSRSTPANLRCSTAPVGVFLLALNANVGLGKFCFVFFCKLLASSVVCGYHSATKKTRPLRFLPLWRNTRIGILGALAMLFGFKVWSGGTRCRHFTSLGIVNSIGAQVSTQDGRHVCRTASKFNSNAARGGVDVQQPPINYGGFGKVEFRWHSIIIAQVDKLAKLAKPILSHMWDKIKQKEVALSSAC